MIVIATINLAVLRGHPFAVAHCESALGLKFLVVVWPIWNAVSP
jgi:hypothetical protein